LAQGERACDRDVRQAMRTIARDELGHAHLSWQMAEWIEARLSDEERAAVAAERQRAIAELEREIDRATPASWRHALGMPSREESRTIFTAMYEALWDARVAA
jgi:hypothetical protein